MVSLKQRQSGFTIVELLIVIVIIGILATLVIVTFSGVQQKARDSERKTDINAIAGQLEAVYANKGAYPSLAQINDSAWRSSNEFRIDTKAFADPKNASSSTLTVGVATVPTTPTGTWTYYYYPDNCGSAAAATDLTPACEGYKLYSNMEATSDPTKVYSRQSTN